MDAVKVLIVFLVTLGIPFACSGLWWWFGFWWGIGTVLAVAEIIAKKTTGNTISKMFWLWKQDPNTKTWKKWAVLVGMVAFWGYLLGHLFFNW